ncbi:MAG: DUF393 domain-containing protein [Candidatus Kapabacteria bacterium]|nr:DUF393 domain-containing protein [Candidatus Kapabacteria bacterium]
MEHTSHDTAHPVVFFDGVCNLCNSTVQYVIERDPDALFRFSSLQSPFAQRELGARGIVISDPPESVLLLHHNHIYSESAAIITLLRLLGGWYRIATLLLIVPAFIRNPVYRWVARSRYRWFGVQESCMMPSPNLRHRFLEE